MKNQGCRREKPHPVNLPPTVKQGVEGHQERRQEVATDRQEGHPGGERREKGSQKAVLSGGGGPVGLYPQARNPVLAQPQDQRKSLESAAETSVV